MTHTGVVLDALSRTILSRGFDGAGRNFIELRGVC
jgi:hypothetical protein